ncbi:MAG: ABC transporter ATP-binding protein [Candidatus Nanopelagicales bacterium]|nr:ABC transporter ATP-binding protein [Candidatus Nanopelagicales bacterium]
MITFEGASKTYPDGTVAVHPLDLQVNKGEVCVLVGASGCGKTTTMRMINRLQEPTTGRVLVDGRDVMTVPLRELRLGMGYVIQQIGLFPHQTVRRNIATVCNLLKWDKKRVDDRVDEMLELVGLPAEEFGNRYPHQLSGGQRQRVGVARGLAADPPVLLMDEPFGAVDPIARARLQDQFLALQERVRKTVVIVTHDIDEAVRLGDRIAVMRPGGYLEQYAAPAEVLANPATPFVAEFTGTDRSLKLLAVTPVESGELEAAGPEASSLDNVPADCSLREALAVLLDSPVGRVSVGDPANPDGVLTMDGVFRALRISTDDLPSSSVA